MLGGTTGHWNTGSYKQICGTIGSWFCVNISICPHPFSLKCWIKYYTPLIGMLLPSNELRYLIVHYAPPLSPLRGNAWLSSLHWYTDIQCQIQWAIFHLGMVITFLVHGSRDRNKREVKVLCYRSCTGHCIVWIRNVLVFIMSMIIFSRRY